MTPGPSLHRPWRHGVWLLLLGLSTVLVPRAWAEGAASGIWRGGYGCAQGHTALTLVLHPAGEEEALQGVFYFHAAPGNPGVPEGCFTVNGTYDARSREVRLQAGQWLLQPPGYVTVDLDGRLAPDGERLSGHVTGPSCTVFDLQRAPTSPAPVPAPCLGAPAIA